VPALTHHDHSNAGVDMISSGHRSQEKHEEAEPLYRRVLGPEYPHTASTLNNLAALYDS
jgi:hypothetical protein